MIVKCFECLDRQDHPMVQDFDLAENELILANSELELKDNVYYFVAITNFSRCIIVRIEPEILEEDVTIFTKISFHSFNTSSEKWSSFGFLTNWFNPKPQKTITRAGVIGSSSYDNNQNPF